MKRLISVILILTILTAVLPVSAEEHEYFIICNPKSYVCVRRTPKKGAEESGRLDCGDKFISDGKKKNGYIHVLGVTEDGEGWVHRGYVIEDQPTVENLRATVAATGRVKTRRYIGGKKLEWLEVCTDVWVYAISDEWAVTNRGFIRTKYLEVWNE